MYLESSNIFYKYQFGFRANHSANHALTEITEQIRNARDKGRYTSVVYLDIQKAFDTVNQNILLAKLKQGIKGTSFDWFKSFICDRVQYTSMGLKESSTKIVSHRVPQGSGLGPLLCIISINDLNKSVKNSKVHHYADDTSLLLTEKSLKEINKQVNQDLDLICRWLRANKISLNTSKTEIIIFRSEQKQITKHLNFGISGQKINTCSKVRYLNVILEEHLDWNLHINSLKHKLNRAIGILSKIRDYVPKFLLNTLYYTMFHSHLIYSCQIWGQNNTFLRKLEPLQNRAMRIKNFKNNEYIVNELCKTNKILKIADYIKLLNCLFVKDVIAQSTIPSFQEFFIKMRDTH